MHNTYQSTRAFSPPLPDRTPPRSPPFERILLPRKEKVLAPATRRVLAVSHLDEPGYSRVAPSTRDKHTHSILAVPPPPTAHATARVSTSLPVISKPLVRRPHRAASAARVRRRRQTQSSAVSAGRSRCSAPRRLAATPSVVDSLKCRRWRSPRHARAAEAAPRD